MMHVTYMYTGHVTGVQFQWKGLVVRYRMDDWNSWHLKPVIYVNWRWEASVQVFYICMRCLLPSSLESKDTCVQTRLFECGNIEWIYTPRLHFEEVHCHVIMWLGAYYRRTYTKCAHCTPCLADCTNPLNVCVQLCAVELCYSIQYNRVLGYWVIQHLDTSQIESRRCT